MSGASLNGQVPQPTSAEDLSWKPSFDRASVDAYLAEVEIERARLQAEISAARAAIEASERAVAARQSEAVSELGAAVVAGRSRLAQIEDEHAQIIATISEAAAKESARILAAAYREAAAMRDSTVAFARLVAGGAEVDPAAAPSVAPSPNQGQADAG